jgi:hypothetical protein
MGHLERGEKNLSFLSILRVAKALDITLSELLAGFEKGESARLANRKTPGASAANRGRALGQVATMERSLRALKGVLAESAASSKSARRGRGSAPKTKRRKSL